MEFQEQFDAIVKSHLESHSADYIENLKEEFSKNHVVVIDSLLPGPLKAALSAEAKYLMAEEGKRRDLIMKISGNTPRHYFSVGRDRINENGKLIPAFFHSQVIRDFLTKVYGDVVYKVPYEPEEFIINRQQATGDTHGWHWDDYTFALIWMVEAPAEGCGALVEYVPHTEWDKTDFENCVNKVLEVSTVQRKYIPQDTCYFMKANTTLHQISPLTSETRRTVIIYTYASEADMTNGKISHESMEEIYPEDTGASMELV